MAHERKTNDKRLPKEAQDMVCERLIAGASNSEVRQALHNAGYPSDLTHAALYYYRNTRRVKDAIALASHEEYQSGYGPASRRVAACKALLEECLRSIRDGQMVPVEVPAEKDADGKVHTEKFTRWERHDLRPIDFQRYANVAVSVIAQLSKQIDGIYQGTILPAEMAEKAAEEAAKSDKKSASPWANLTRTQALAFWNDMVETIINDERDKVKPKTEEAISAPSLIPPSPNREIPADPDENEDDFGDEND